MRQSLVADLSDEQMIYQPAPGMNHPAWIFSHLNVYHPVISKMLIGEPFEDPQHHVFGMRSKPETDRSIYATKSELSATFQHGHARIEVILNEVEASAFERAMSLERWKLPFPTIGSALGYLMLAHEATHLGQLSAWRRVQGLSSV